MDKRTLYVANLAETVDADQLAAVFAAHGEVASVELSSDAQTGAAVARVTMQAEKDATKAINAVNGVDVGGRRLAVSYPEVDLSKDLTSKQRKVAEAIAAELGETEKVPLRKIHMIVRLCSAAFAQAIVAEAKALDAGEGMMTIDGTRRRTLGGVFFELVAQRLAPGTRYIVINRKGKPPPTAR